MSLLVVRTASAHPPHEQTVARIARDDGNALVLFKSYVDGIFSVDPVKLVVRDGNGEPLDETEFGRDILTACEGADCTVYRYDGALAITPAEVFEIRGSALVLQNRASAKAAGAIAHLVQHVIGYMVATTLFVVLLWGVKSAWRRGGWIRLFGGGTGIGAVLLWWYAIGQLSRLSLGTAMLLGVIAALLTVFACSWLNRGQNGSVAEVTR